MQTNSTPDQSQPTTGAPEAPDPTDKATPASKPASKNGETKPNRGKRTATTGKPAAGEPKASNGKSTAARAPKSTGNAKKATAEKPAASKPRSSGPRQGSMMWAVIEVLKDADGDLSAKEIYAEIDRRKLAPGLKGKTPDQSVAAAIAVHAKRGLYVERSAPGKFRLLQANA